MADPLSLCASILGVAGAGIRLSTGLYTFSQTVLRADSSIKDVALDIALTSSVLEELGTLLAAGDRARLCSKRAARTASEAINGCKGVFDEIDGLLKGSTKNKSQFVLSGFGKLKWPLTEKKMQFLRSNLDRLKSTLILLLNVLNYARDLHADKVGSATPELQIQRRQIEELVKLNEVHQERFLELRSIDESEKSTLAGSSSSIRSFDPRDQLNECAPSRPTVREDEDYQYQRETLRKDPRSRATEVNLAFSPNPCNPSPPPPPSVPKESSDQSYASVLRKCEEAVRGLVDHLQKADVLMSTANEPGLNLYVESVRYLCETLSVHTGRLPVSSTAGHVQRVHGASFRAGRIDNDGSDMSAGVGPINTFVPPGLSNSNDEKLRDYHSRLAFLEQQNRERIMLQREAQYTPINPPRQDAAIEEAVAAYPLFLRKQHMELQAQQALLNSSSQGTTSNGGVLADYQMQLMLLEQQNKKRLMMARQRQDVHGARHGQTIGDSASEGGPGGLSEAPQAENVIKVEGAESAAEKEPVDAQMQGYATSHDSVAEPQDESPPQWRTSPEDSTNGPIGMSYKIKGTVPLAMQATSSFFGSHPTATTPLETSAVQSMPSLFDVSQPPMIEQEHLESFQARASPRKLEIRQPPPPLDESTNAQSSPGFSPTVFTPDGSEPDEFMTMAPEGTNMQIETFRSGFASGGENGRAARDALALADGITVEQLMAEWTTLVL